MIKAFFGSVPATVHVAPAPPSICPLPGGAANREPLQLASCSFVIICLNGIEIQAVYSVNSMRPKLIRCHPGVTGQSGYPCQGLACGVTATGHLSSILCITLRATVWRILLLQPFVVKQPCQIVLLSASGLLHLQCSSQTITAF
jgi:hypothetical protein